MGGYVYIIANRRRGATYIGVTSDIIARLYQHREKQTGGHASRYNISRLVFYEVHATMPLAIQREKNLKSWRQAWKFELIENVNPHWDDLWEEIVKSPF
ncbi:GIY-YIG nuclease family protein [Pelagibacterium halotolerans]|uniref:Excinuclease ABC, C subunit domain protein n=1 Tax=Pelagibacterium halotolerans (strain DSM 22347 / JCM 15775 / CGMCC 1.7692 / B2) TaxID=1082931 RepID=G4R7J1_PELHB|nr:GIY-YIG nuclease family protein [Pelagibacterium halotolerans]AEQ52292.1 excinuclease ABC, C subunit domain protein [Pelagibacterium halotolerans B2]QJR17961.1 GIY-YIG nuclease family protein [Pelagibacterium halotolerans]SEA32349.1 putative endonuclease [Pelagibacterium halotolerans]